MRRSILKHQHPRQRTALALLAVLAACLRLVHQPGRLQRKPRHRVAEPVAVLAHHCLVEVLGAEVAIPLAIQPTDATKLRRVGAPWRRSPQAPIAQALEPVRLEAHAQPAEVTPRHPHQFARLIRTQPTTPEPIQRVLEPAHENAPQNRLPTHAPPLEQPANKTDISPAPKSSIHAHLPAAGFTARLWTCLPSMSLL